MKFEYREFFSKIIKNKIPIYYKSEKLVLECHKQNHKLQLISNSSQDKIEIIKCYFLNNILSSWDLENKELSIIQNKVKSNFPFFYPDFNDFTKLQNKIKTYLIFAN
jgi:hypothetical protein